MQKCIVEVIFKDGQTDLIQTDYIDSEGFSVYKVFELYSRIVHKIYEIKFVRMVQVN